MDTSLLIISWTLSSLSRWSLLGYVPCALTCTHPLLLLNNNVVAVIPVYYYRHSINLFLMLFCCYFAVDFCFRLGFSIPVNLFKPITISHVIANYFFNAILIVTISPINIWSALLENFPLCFCWYILVGLQSYLYPCSSLSHRHRRRTRPRSSTHVPVHYGNHPDPTDHRPAGSP